MAWEIILLDEVSEWFSDLDPVTEKLVTAALDLLEERGPMLGRPLVDTLTGTALPNLKELHLVQPVRLKFASCSSSTPSAKPFC